MSSVLIDKQEVRCGGDTPACRTVIRRRFTPGVAGWVG